MQDSAQNFVESNQSDYEKHSKAIDKPGIDDKEKFTACLEFLGIEDINTFHQLPLVEKKAKVKRLYNQKSLYFSVDKIDDRSLAAVELATKMSALLHSSKKFIDEMFAQQMQPKKKQKEYLSQHTTQFQYELVNPKQFFTNRSLFKIYTDIIDQKECKLKRNWKDLTDELSAALTIPDSDEKMAEEITVSGADAFFLLLKTGALFKYKNYYDDERLVQAIFETENQDLQAKILSDDQCDKWIKEGTRKFIANKLFTDSKYHEAALTKKYFNLSININKICDIAYVYKPWNANFKNRRPEEVFIFYYENYPHLLRAKEFFAISNFNKFHVLEHIQKNPKNLHKLHREDLTAIADFQNVAINGKIIVFNDPLAAFKLMEPLDWFGKCYWKTFIDNLINNLYPDKQPQNEFERYCKTQFYLGKLNAVFLSEGLINQIKSEVNTKSNLLPQWITKLWMDTKVDEGEIKQERLQFEMRAKFELLTGKFSILPLLSKSVLTNLLNDQSLKKVHEKIQSTLDNPNTQFSDIPESEKLRFIGDNLQEVENSLEEKIEEYLKESNPRLQNDVDLIKYLYQHTLKAAEQIASPTLLKNIKSNCLDQYIQLKKKLLSDQAISEEEKLKLTKLAEIGHAFQILAEEESGLNNASLWLGEYDINGVEAHYEKCKILDINILPQLEYDFINTFGISPKFENTDKFPREKIKELLIEDLRVELTVFIEGKRKQQQIEGYHSIIKNRRDISSFEKIKRHYANLGAHEEYKKALLECYEKIKRGEAPLEKYYEIRKVETTILCNDLEILAIQHEAVENLAVHFPGSNDNLPVLDSSSADKVQELANKVYTAVEKQNSSFASVLSLPAAPSSSSSSSLASTETKILSTVNVAAVLENTTLSILEILREIADDYDPDNQKHRGFVDDLRSETLSPILSEFFKSVHIKDKVSVKKAAQSLLEKFSRLVIHEAVNEPLSIIRTATISQIKATQNALTKEIKVMSSLTYRRGIERANLLCQWIDNYTPHIKVPPASYNKKEIEQKGISVRSLITKIDDLQISDFAKSTIIKFIFEHFDTEPDISTGITLLLQSNINIDEIIQLYLEILSEHLPEKTKYRGEFVTFPDGAFETFPDKVAKLICDFKTKNQPINKENLKIAITGNEIESVTFYRDYHQFFPQENNLEDRLKRIYANKFLNRSLWCIARVGHENMGGYYYDKRISYSTNPFTPAEVHELMSCAEKYPENFYLYTNILSTKLFKREFIPVFCAYIEKISLEKKKVKGCEIHNHKHCPDFSEKFSVEQVTEKEFLLILQYSDQIYNIYQNSEPSSLKLFENQARSVEVNSKGEVRYVDVDPVAAPITEDEGDDKVEDEDDIVEHEEDATENDVVSIVENADYRIDANYIELVILLESAKFKSNADVAKYKNAVLNTIYPDIIQMDRLAFIRFLYKNIKLFADNLELTRQLINHLNNVSSYAGLYLVTCLAAADVDKKILADQVDTNYFEIIFSKLKLESKPYSPCVTNCISYLEEMLIGLSLKERKLLEEDIQLLLSKFTMPLLTAQLNYDTVTASWSSNSSIGSNSSSTTTLSPTPSTFTTTSATTSTIVSTSSASSQPSTITTTIPKNNNGTDEKILFSDDEEEVSEEKEKEEKPNFPAIDYSYKAVIFNSRVYIKAWKTKENSDEKNVYYLKSSEEKSNQLERVADEGEIPSQLTSDQKIYYVATSEIKFTPQKDNDDICKALSDAKLFATLTTYKLVKPDRTKISRIVSPLNPDEKAAEAKRQETLDVNTIQNTIVQSIQAVYGVNFKLSGIEGIKHSRVLTAERLCNINAGSLAELKEILIAEGKAIGFSPDNSYKMWAGYDSIIGNIITSALNNEVLKKIELNPQNQDLGLKGINDLKRQFAHSLLDYVDTRERSFKFKHNRDPNSSTSQKIKKAGELAHQLLKCKSEKDFQEVENTVQLFIKDPLFQTSKLLDILDIMSDSSGRIILNRLLGDPSLQNLNQ